MAPRPQWVLAIRRPLRTERTALLAIPQTPTATGSWPRLTRPCQALQAAARTSATASSRSWGRRRRKANRAVARMAGRAASNCRWAGVDDAPDRLAALMRAISRGWGPPRAGDGPRVDRPFGGTSESDLLLIRL